jgi:hypothetical protein
LLCLTTTATATATATATCLEIVGTNRESGCTEWQCKVYAGNLNWQIGTIYKFRKPKVSYFLQGTLNLLQIPDRLIEWRMWVQRLTEWRMWVQRLTEWRMWVQRFHLLCRQ